MKVLTPQQIRQKLVKELDKLCSEYVRRRDFARFKGCARCGHSKSNWQELQWAHLISRTYLKTRWNPDAQVGICGGCHMHIDKEPDAKTELAIRLIGEVKFELLKAAARDTGKVDYNLWKLYLQQELEALG